jgi:hypothetical protein
MGTAEKVLCTALGWRRARQARTFIDTKHCIYALSVVPRSLLENNDPNKDERHGTHAIHRTSQTQPKEWTMKLMTQEPSRLPVDDYSAALRNAVSWLGERYLLAVPVTRSEQAGPRYFPQGRGWHERLDVKR